MDFEGDNEQAINEIEADFLTEQELENGEQILPFVDEVVFLVHLHPDLLAEQGGEVPLKVIVQGFVSFIKSKIISRSSDKVGLVVFNSSRTNNSLNFAGIDVVHALAYPSAEMVLKSNALLHEDFAPAEAPLPLHEALWICNHIFKELGSKAESSKRIFLFTSEDVPPGGSEEARAQAESHAKQLNSCNVEIELFPIRLKGRIFNYAAFYSGIITVDPDEVSKDLIDPSDKLSDLAVRIRKREFKKKRLGRVDFRISEGVIVGTQFYALINQIKMPSGLNLNAENNKIVKTIHKFVCAETRQELYEKDIGHYIPLGEKKVEFTKEEMNRIKEFGEPGLVLVGFKPRDRLKIYHNIKAPYFIYPDDERVENSSKFFDGLIESMLKLKKIAIARFIPRNCSKVRFVALVPQQE